MITLREKKGEGRLLHILMGRARTGKSERVLQRIAALGDSSQQILLVPEHASHVAEMDLCRVCGDTASRHAEALTFKLLASRVLSICGGSADVTLDSGGKLLTLQRTLTELAPVLKVYKRPSQRAAFLESLLAVMEELQAYAVSPEQLSESVAQIEGESGDKLRDLSLIYGIYLSKLHAPGHDARDVLEKLEENLEASGYIENKDIFLDGFSYFTGRELNILRLLLRRTNSVTVTLLGEIFRNAGRTTHVVGNIGYPYSAAGLDSQDGDLFVCEVSSFQMETAETFHPKAAALLNITEDHLNRHGTMEVYTAMKMRQFQNMTAEDVAVFNADDPALAPLIGQVKAQVMLFSRKREVDQGAFVRDGEIVVRFHGAEETICPAKDVFIPGPHNLENALAACCIAAAMGVKPDVMAHTLRTFQGVEHRIEFVRELDGVRYINDSKGTNVDSTIKAIQTMTRPTAIILGGYDKHCDFTPMVQEMLASPYIKEAVLIGATADQIERTCRENDYTHLHRAGTLKDAIDQCRALSSDGWNVLLSPACASFDMFSDYESRGRIFKELVRELK